MSWPLGDLVQHTVGLWAPWLAPARSGQKSPAAFAVNLVLAASQDRSASWARGVFSPGKNRKEMKGSQRLQTTRGSLLITVDTVLDGLWGGRACLCFTEQLVRD